MENTNPSGKTLGELIKISNLAGAHILLIEDIGEVMRSAELIASISKKIKVEIINIHDLPKADQDKLAEAKIMELCPPKPIEIKITAPMPLPHMPKLTRDDLNKQWYEKLSPSKKRRKW